MKRVPSPAGRIIMVAWAAILAFVIALAGQGIWAVLVNLNLATSPDIPWAAAAMAILLWLIWRYLGGTGWPRRTSEARRRHLRANPVSGPVLAWALVAGALSVVALAGYWIVMTSIVRMPGNVLPDTSRYSLLLVVPTLAVASLVSPVLEDAGFWGYGQVILDGEFGRKTAVVIIAALYALGPHPPTAGPAWPRLIFYFLTGIMLAVLAYRANSILPGLVVHILGILAFFTLVWPYDATRRLIGDGGADAGFWIHVAQGPVFTMLAILAFQRLANIAKRAAAFSPR